ncbi:MAG TPA: hypothetical protein VFU98_00960 [Microlunatus sp.]|nr:hypothetical protein [Microlunatus sp.]
MLEATLPQLAPGAVLSHGSAAVVHDLPVWRHSLLAAHVMRDGNGGGQRREYVHLHRTPLDDDEVTTVDGFQVTDLARTVADVGRAAPRMESVAAGDYALRRGLDLDALGRAIASMYRWPGVRNARWMADFLDIRSESPGESASRVRMSDSGIPEPDLQYEIFDDDGVFIARVDFAWEERRTVGEFDGEIKYGRLLLPGQTREQVLADQSVREDAIRSAGWEIARWGWPQLGEGDEIASRIRRAFRLARERGLVKAAEPSPSRTRTLAEWATASTSTRSNPRGVRSG